ncbi:MAG TPA: hypothetical protein VKC17_07180 [Sphingomicrobium sp.]|nr:hypothetical protein [Sphingomicrobium sp.]
MRLFAFAALLTLAACSRAENTFIVEDEQQSVTAGSLVLCGSTTPLQRLDGRLSVSKRIGCEGHGYIRLTYKSGREWDCPVGYVTPGAKQDFKFRATEADCQPLVS